MTALDLLVGLAILVGVVGVLVPVLPGLLLVLGAVVAWALERHDATGWVVLAVVLVLFAVGQVAKYVLPGRRLRDAGVPWSTTAAGGVLGVIGFFVVGGSLLLMVDVDEGQRVAREWDLKESTEPAAAPILST